MDALSIDATEMDPILGRRYALLGKELFNKCQNSEVLSSRDVARRIQNLRRWYQVPKRGNFFFEYDNEDKEHIKQALAPIDLSVPYKTRVSFNDVKHFTDVCELTQGIINPSDLFTKDWRDNASIVHIDGLSLIKLPAGTILFTGMSLTQPFDVNNVPKYFSNIKSAANYAFYMYRRTAESGKIIPFQLKRDILVLNTGDIENWKKLIPSRRFVPQDVLIAANKAFNYSPKADQELSRRGSQTQPDNAVFTYLWNLPQVQALRERGLVALGSERIDTFHEEIVFTDANALQEAGYALPYEIITKNEMTHCAFVILVRSTVDGRTFHAIAPLSQQEMTIDFWPDEGVKNLDASPEQLQEMRERCMERAVGNIDIDMYDFSRIKFF